MTRRTSVIMVNLNSPRIETALRSLRDQTHSPNEIIVCDGGSSRDNLEIATSLADRVYTPLRGIGNARVYGVLKAAGDVIVSADSDTYYPPSHIETALEYLDRAVTGPIIPHQETPEARMESMMSFVIPKVAPIVYEHNLVFRRDLFLKAGLHRVRYPGRLDIGPAIASTMLPTFVRDMPVRTEMPTSWFRMLVSPWLALYKGKESIFRDDKT